MSKDGDGFNPSWFLIVFMLAVFWPVGLWFLWCKLQNVSSNDEASRKKRGKRISVGGLGLLALAVIIMAEKGTAALWAAFLGIGGVAMLLFDGFTKKRNGRFKRYMAIIGKRVYVSLDTIMSATGYDRKTVCDDLQTMIDKKWFGEYAYLDIGGGVMVTDSRFAPEPKAAKQTAKAAPEPPKQTAKAEPKPKAAAQSAPARPGVVIPERERSYVETLRQIRKANDAIKDEKVSAQIERIEHITGNIFEVITEYPDKQKEAHTFLNYYLPTTLKLLSAYGRLEKQNVSGENIDSAKAKIEGLLNQLVWAFERQNDQLFKTEAMDIDSDISVMETMLQKDGLSENGGALPSDPFAAALGRKPSGAAVAQARK